MEIQPLIDHINRVVHLSDADVETLQHLVTVRRYRRGQYIVQSGDVCRYESFVLEGCLRSYFVDAKGGEHVVMLAAEEWWIADLASFLNSTPASYNIECIEPTTVVQITLEAMEELYHRAPVFERYFRLIIQRAYIASQQRILENVSLSARDRYLTFIERYGYFEQRIPQYMIASYLGMTREFLSKIKSAL